MFVQVIQGRVSDRGELRAALERWVAEQAPGAPTWLGTTAGVTDDGEFIGLARFSSEEAARRNSERPEQHQWWMEVSKLFAGEVTFHDCPDTMEFLAGGSDDAGLVQVMQGRIRDMEPLWELLGRATPVLAMERPDLIGGLIALHKDHSGFTESVYFTSEEAARQGGSKEPSAEARALLEEEMSLLDGDLRYLDLREPWLFSPR